MPVPHHPSSQGFVQALGVFIDTILICTATAIMILLSGVLEPGSGVTGTQLAMVIWGAIQAVATVFDTANASMGLMATINLLAILALSGTVAKLTRDYFAQRKAGVEPTFHGRDYPELGDRIDHSIWNRD